MRPEPMTTICDPACGTGGFFLAAHDYISKHYQLDRDQKNFLIYSTFKGWEIVDATARLCAMNTRALVLYTLAPVVLVLAETVKKIVVTIRTT